MKTSHLLISFALTAAPGSLFAADSVPAGAAPAGRAARPPEWAELFGNVPLPIVWQSVVTATDKITAALAERKLDEIPDWAETIHLGAHALPSQIKLADADSQATLVEAFRLAALIADDITANAWAGDVAKTNSAFQKARTALGIGKRYLPKDILEAAPQSVRFAKKPRPANPAAK